MRNDSFAVAIASKGRPKILSETVASLENQTVAVEHVFLAVTSSIDFEPSCAERPEVSVVVCPPGLTRQRNAALDQAVGRFEFVIFLDDDMQLHPEYIETAVRFLRKNTQIAGISGHLLRNGKICRADAKQLVDSYQPDPRDARPVFRDRGRYWTLHGCNMVLRASALEHVRFDENLPLYGYAEDYDISLRIRAHGLVGRYRECIAVHLETPSGRVSEKRLGYSILANNWYFLGKRVTHCPTVLLGYARFVLRIAMLEPLRNAGSALMGNRGRAERLRGNVLALRDILTGNCSPGRINDLD